MIIFKKLPFTHGCRATFKDQCEDEDELNEAVYFLHMQGKVDVIHSCRSLYCNMRGCKCLAGHIPS